jgi:multiple sugar transport system permease protein
MAQRIGSISAPGSAVAVPGQADVTRSERKREIQTRRSWLGARGVGTAFTLPAWLLIICVGLIPIGYAIYTSFTSSSLNSSGSAQFVGMRNYVDGVLRGGFWGALQVTLLIVAIGLIVQFPIGYLLASCLNRRPAGYRWIQTILLVPLMLTPVAVGEMWLLIFDPSIGIAKYLAAPFVHSPNWLGSEYLALGVIIFVDAWLNIPFIMIMLLAGMSGLPRDPQEAAALDGASWWQATRYVILPGLRNVIIVALLLRVIADFQIFDIIYVLTAGGPGTSTQSLGLLVYQDTFQFFATAAGAALAVSMAIIMIPVYIAFAKFTKASFS